MKICSICNLLLSEDSFYKNNRKPNQYQSYCKKCSKIKRKQYFIKNLKKELETRKVYSEKQKQKYIDYKKTLCCSSCFEKRWYLLDFHHVDDNKEHNVASMVCGRFSWDSILNEIKKCETLCANCHREKHFLQKQSVAASIPVTSIL
jgi:hypothetical protein